MAPPSRPLLVVTLALVASFTVLRFMTAASLDLRSDEAYYWTWSYEAVLSFLDQPPMVAWFERFGQLIFGNTTLGARFAQLLALPLIELLLADIARRRTDSWNAALFVILALECTLNYGLFSIVIEPSMPLLLFTSVIAVVAAAGSTRPMEARWWIVIGVAGGLALLSKYIVLLLAPALLVFLLIAPRHRKWLTARVAISCGRNRRSAVRAGADLERAAWLGLVRVPEHAPRRRQERPASAACSASRRTRRCGSDRSSWSRRSLASLYWPSVGCAAGNRWRLPLRRRFSSRWPFFLIRSLTLQINQSWAWFLWPIGVLGLALVIPWGRAPRRVGTLIAAIAVTGVPMVSALFFHALFDDGVWLGRGDPFGQDAGFGEMADRVLADAQSSGAKWIATTDYRTYANLSWHIGDRIPGATGQPARALPRLRAA